jgi:starch synthase
MRVLFAVWELAPFFHVGGLGDVARSLPKALQSSGVDIRIILPYYKALKLFKLKREKIKTFSIIYDKKREKVALYQIHFLDANLPVYIIQNKKYLDIPNSDIFPFFNLAIIEILEKNYLSWQPEIIHCNDNHEGLIPFLVKHKKLPYKTLLTIHNLTHQGKMSSDIIVKMGIDPGKCQVIRWEIKKRQINRLLEGIVHADLVNTVSPTYAKEILTERYGAGIDELIRNEKQKISGILNGLDYDTRCPLKDKNIIHHYNETEVKGKYPYKIYSPAEGKKMNKQFLQEKLGLTVSDKIPLIGFIGRFDSKQKGIELIHKMIRRVNLKKIQFVILGEGEIEWVERFNWLARFYEKSVAYVSVFDDRLASQIYSACDFLLVPSKYEPCGLIQMIAMRYGTLPIARATGGLKDSIIDGVDGFLFKDYSSFDLEKKLKQAIEIWRNNKLKYQTMVLAAMIKDFSWNKSAKEYISLYKKLMTSV